MVDGTSGEAILNDEFWDRSVRRHERKIHNALIARGVPAMEADDIANETWMLLWSKRHQLRIPSEAHFVALAMRQAWFLALSRFRTTGRQRWTNFEGAKDPVAEVSPVSQILDANEDLLRSPLAPDISAEKAEERRAINAEISALPPGWQRVLTLHYWDEMPHRDIADRLGVTVQRVRDILYQSRERLRKQYKGGKDDPSR